MCKKNKGCGRRIDKCMIHLIDFINKNTNYKTLACCCGHNKYPMSIVIKMKEGYNARIELLSDKLIPRKRKFYKKDKQGYFYIPEVQK